MRRIRLFLVTAVLLAAVWFGLREGVNGLLGSANWFQRNAAVAQVAYGVCAVLSLVALFRRRAWLRPAVIAWAIALTITGTVAPVAWSGSPWSVGLLSGVITAAVAGVVAWAALAHPSPDNRV